MNVTEDDIQEVLAEYQEHVGGFGDECCRQDHAAPVLLLRRILRTRSYRARAISAAARSAPGFGTLRVMV